MQFLTCASFSQFSDECDLRDGCMCAQLIWSFEVSPAPAAVQLPPTSVPPTGEIDIHLPPVDLEATANCTCFNNNKLQIYIVQFPWRDDQLRITTIHGIK